MNAQSIYSGKELNTMARRLCKGHKGAKYWFWELVINDKNHVAPVVLRVHFKMSDETTDYLNCAL